MWPGRTLEETAALFDGEQPQRDLARFGDAAILSLNLARGVPLTRLTEKLTDYSPEIPLDLSRSYASQPFSESRTDSHRQSLESSIAVAIWTKSSLLVVKLYCYVFCMNNLSTLYNIRIHPFNRWVAGTYSVVSILNTLVKTALQPRPYSDLGVSNRTKFYYTLHQEKLTLLNLFLFNT